jgi:hypothetical protein
MYIHKIVVSWQDVCSGLDLFTNCCCWTQQPVDESIYHEEEGKKLLQNSAMYQIAWLQRRTLVLELSSLLVLHCTWSLGLLAANNIGLEKMYSESRWVSQGASSLFHINLFWNCHISSTKQFTRIIFSQYEEKRFLHYFSAWRKGLKNRQIFCLTFALKE